MKNGQPEAQDFTTSELIEALRARNLNVLTAPVHAEITRAQREATRAECAAETEAKLATARAEAALAEREALVFYVDRALRYALGGVFRTAYVLAVADAFRARTTSATLSTETLAAIAEARGLRVVEPELLAGLEPPVLRWGYTAAHESEAKVSGWHLTAAERNWALIHESGVKVLSPRPNRADERDNRLVAEAALRSLGVAFRVEDGGAK